jgi:predicted HicB family RNase H-like nuclease
MMNYKGYIGTLRVDDEAGVLRGRVINTRDTITFQGKTVDEAKKAFVDSVEDYLEFCASLGEPPEKPFSGRFVVRITPTVHRRLAAIAQIKGVSINKLIHSQLNKLTKREWKWSVRPPDARDKQAAEMIKKQTKRMVDQSPTKQVKRTTKKTAAG